MPREIVYVGMDDFTLAPPEPVDDEKPAGFKAVFHLEDLDELHSRYDSSFRYVQVICSAYEQIQCWSANTVFVPYRAVRWLVCFPVEKQGRRYVPVTYTLPPCGDDVFYYFTGVAPDETPIRAVPSLDGLNFLSPSAASQLALVRVQDWRWNKGRHTVSVRPQDVIETETVRYSRARVF
jgi:hypothetical protein